LVKKFLLLLVLSNTAWAKCAILFVPGAFAAKSTASVLFLNPTDYFKDYIEAAKSWGCETKMAELPPDATIEEQGIILKEEVIRFSTQQKSRISIIAHSQGALDAVYIAHDFKLENFIGNLVSIGTPFYGTPLADWAISQRKNKSFIYYLLKWVGSYDLMALNFAPELTPGFMAGQKAHFLENPGIRYAYARGVCLRNCHLIFRLLNLLAGDNDGNDINDNKQSGDGLIPSSSQKQAYGSNLGDFDLDHISEVGAGGSAEHEARGALLSRIRSFLAPSF